MCVCVCVCVCVACVRAFFWPLASTLCGNEHRSMDWEGERERRCEFERERERGEEEEAMAGKLPLNPNP